MKRFQILVEGGFEVEGRSLTDVAKAEADVVDALTKGFGLALGAVPGGVTVRAARLVVSAPSGHHSTEDAVVDIVPVTETPAAPVADPVVETVPPVEPPKVEGDVQNAPVVT